MFTAFLIKYLKFNRNIIGLTYKIFCFVLKRMHCITLYCNENFMEWILKLPLMTVCCIYIRTYITCEISTRIINSFRLVHISQVVCYHCQIFTPGAGSTSEKWLYASDILCSHKLGVVTVIFQWSIWKLINNFQICNIACRTSTNNMNPNELLN